MRTTISIPDDVFEAAERLARRTKRSRGQLFNGAVREYVVRHTADEITGAMNHVCAEMDRPTDKFAVSTSIHMLKLTEW